MDETRLDKIEIKELEVFANHGVYPEENVLGQKFVISATLFTRTRLAGLTDELSASINYGEVSHMITDFTRNKKFEIFIPLRYSCFVRTIGRRALTASKEIAVSA